ncbi:MAG: chemotaxis protein CheW [Alphaproteobacteria bacterium]
MGDIAITEGAAPARFLTARIAGLDVAFPAAEVGGTAALGPITPVPRSPLGIAGIAAADDRIATVVDLAHCLGGTAAGPSQLAITLERGGHLYALAVDALGDIRAVPPDNVRPLDAGSEEPAARLATGAFRVDGQPVLVLAVSRLLDPETLGAAGPRRVIAAKVPAAAVLAVAEAPPPISVKGPLIDRLGGMAALDRAIHDFLGRAADEPELAPLVAAADRADLDVALRSLAGMLFGAPVFYAGPPLAHVAELGMDSRRFDAALGHMAAALRAAGAAGSDVAEAMEVVEQLRPVVARG